MTHFSARGSRSRLISLVCLALGVVCALTVGPLSADAPTETRIQQGLVRALSAEREALRRVDFQAADATGGTTSRARTPATPPATPDDLRYDRTWLLSRPDPARRNPQFACLKQAIYHEARGEPVRGQFAVAEVILNRVDSPAFPDDVCRVVRQNAHLRNACQFSFVCNGRSLAMNERRARALAARIADIMLAGAERELTDGATHFHTTAVNPRWSRSYVQTTQIGVHIFYRPPTQLSSN